MVMVVQLEIIKKALNCTFYSVNFKACVTFH
jgi:hypothetical protein